MNLDEYVIEEFLDKFDLAENHLNKMANFDGCMFEAYGNELAFVSQFYQNYPEQVWTYVEGDDDEMYAVRGMLIVNRLGYFITTSETPKE